FRQQPQLQHQLQAIQNLLRQLHFQHKSARSSNALIDEIDESFNCVQKKVRLIAVSTQTKYLGNQTCSNHEPVSSLSAVTAKDSDRVSMATTAASGHTMYTVHRVVTTAQIQTAIGNTYTSSSSVSSVVSALRNEEENITSPMAASLPTVNGNCALNLNSCPAAPGRRLTNMEDNSIANNILQSGTAAKDSRQSPG
ncbi:uncharacterized protein LOC118735138, partial [Rhagoletis pomonella]|uniref:uncharacterized protein LOC118735138 n=1 Tax=Rhagoletis pomonella TaxID=28610 RepID=UPI0017804691